MSAVKNETHSGIVRPKNHDTNSEMEEQGSGEIEEEEEEEEERWDEEARKVKTTVDQTLPSEKEVQEHMITHLPFRSWCPHCVRGKAKGMPHRKQENEKEHTVPTVSIDYMYFVKEVEGQKEVCQR